VTHTVTGCRLFEGEYSKSMSEKELLANKMRAARQDRGWTIYHMCQLMSGVFPATVRNLEGAEATRNTNGRDVKLVTAVEICTVLFPDVKLEDFYGEQELLLRLVPDGSRGRRKVEDRQRDLAWG